MIETYMIIGEYPSQKMWEETSSFREDVKVLGIYDTRKETEKAFQAFADLNYFQLEIVHVMPEPIKKSVENVMDYLWKDEALDYASNLDDEGEEYLSEYAHIFESLVVLDNFLYDNERTPKQIIDEL